MLKALSARFFYGPEYIRIWQDLFFLGGIFILKHSTNFPPPILDAVPLQLFCEHNYLGDLQPWERFPIIPQSLQEIVSLLLKLSKKLTWKKINLEKMFSPTSHFINFNFNVQMVVCLFFLKKFWSSQFMILFRDANTQNNGRRRNCDLLAFSLFSKI